MQVDNEFDVQTHCTLPAMAPGQRFKVTNTSQGPILLHGTETGTVTLQPGEVWKSPGYDS